jgi:hydroxypyruvate isomerase
MKRLEETMRIARILDCRRMITCSGNTVKGLTKRQHTINLVKILGQARKLVEREGMTLLLEPLNSVVDHVGYFLDSAKLALQVVRDVGSPNLKLLYDIYHMQIMEGNIVQTISENIQSIGHVHCAGVPGRHELHLGELNYQNIFDKIDELNYEGYVGLEYFPTMKSEESLERLRP